MGIRVEVGIPWRAHSSRLDAFGKTCDWYESRGLTVTATESPKHLIGPFNLAAARNHLVRNRLMNCDVIVLSDADTLPEFEALDEAINAAYFTGKVHLPYHLYRNEEGVYTPGATSGIYVFTPEAWEETNGQDELFTGWGYEDAAWRLAHLTLNGPIPRHEGVAHAAVHELAPRDRVSINRRRYQHYVDAYGNVEAMRLLVEGGSPTPTADRSQAIRLAHARRTIQPLGR